MFPVKGQGMVEMLSYFVLFQLLLTARMTSVARTEDIVYRFSEPAEMWICKLLSVIG